MFRLEVAARDIPLYVYRTREEFGAQMERYVRAALNKGLRGWQVVDSIVTMTRCAFSGMTGRRPDVVRRARPETSAS